MKWTSVFTLFVFLNLCGFCRAQSLDALTKPQQGRSMRASSGNPFDNADSAQFKPGEEKTIAVLRGPGKITHIWMTPNSLNLRIPRAFVLRIYWDGAQTPSVETPLGDFFGVGNGMRANVNSLPVKVSSYGRGYNCYWPMPFRREARITLANESKEYKASCYYQIDWTALKEPDKPNMYFHARYHQEYPPVMNEPYTVFKTEGRGHYVGTVLSSQNGIGHWFGEGDDYFYIDGEKTPSIVGTGTEDYINEAWNMRVHSGAYTGCTVFEPRAPDARVSAYRWHIPDPVIFDKSLKFTIERRGFVMNSKGEVVSSSGSRPDYWSSVSYWYQDAVVPPWCEFPPYEKRINPEIAVLLPQIVDDIRCSDGVELQVNDYNRATWTKPWFRAVNEKIGQWIEIPFNVDVKGRYSISLFQHLREDNGIWKVTLDGRELYEVGEPQIAGGYRVSLVNQMDPKDVNTCLDFFNVFRVDEHEDTIYGRRRERKIGIFEFEPGKHALRLTCIGSNPSSIDLETGEPQYNLTADVLSIRKIPFENMDAWIKDMLQREATKNRTNP